MRRLALVACLTAVALSLAATLPAADWPGWRGPTHDGHAAGEQLVDSFPASGPPVLWIRDLGQGYSGFAVVGGRAYTQTQSLYDQSVVCLDAETGQPLWSYRYGWPYDGGGLYPGPRSTPAVHAGKVYFAAPDGLVGCLTADQGKLVWSVNVNEKFHGRGTDFGYSASPLVIDEIVILPVGGEQASVVALSAADGSLVWKSGSSPASYSTLLPIEWRGEPLIIALLQNSLACFHRRTGELWWEQSLSSGYDEHSAAPIYREPLLIVSGPFRSGAQALRLEEDTATGRCRPSPAWICERLSNDVASSVLVDETVFGFDLKDIQAKLHRPSRGEFRAVDFLTGKVSWSSSEPAHAQVIAANGKLVVFNDRGEVILARASPDAYEELGRAAVFPDEICWTMPALSDGRLFVRTQTRAACLYLGRQPRPAATSVMTTSNLPPRTRFDPGSLLGGEREYPATLPQWSEFALWFWWCLGLLVAATLPAIAASLIAHIRQRSTLEGTPNQFNGTQWIAISYWLVVLVAGVAGSSVLNRWQADYVFTWPLTLWAAFQIAVTFSWNVRHTRLWSWNRARCYAIGLAFFVLCGLYFHLCRWLGLAIEWAFLTGFLGALPAAILAAWLSERSPATFSGRIGLAYLASFVLYYWSCVGFVAWRMGG